MRKSLFLLFGLLPFCSLTSAQNKILLYFNKDWEVTTKEKAVYLREAEYDLQNFKLNGKVTDRDLKGNPVMEGNYLNGRKDGLFTFYKNEKIESQGTYKNDKRSGEWKYYYPDGQIKQTIIFYSRDQKKGDFGIGEYYDQQGKQLIRNGRGKWLSGYLLLKQGKDSVFLQASGKVKDSLKTGNWKLNILPNNKLLVAETFSKGVRYSASYHAPVQYSSSPGKIEQKIRDEMRTGYAHENLNNPAIEHVQFGDVNWRILQREGRVTPSDGGIALPEGWISRNNISFSPGASPPFSENVMDRIKSGSLDIDKIPDKNLHKLKSSEMLILDTVSFSKATIDYDLETFFKTISETNILIKNRKAMYPYGQEMLDLYIKKNIHYPANILDNCNRSDRGNQRSEGFKKH